MKKVVQLFFLISSCVLSATKEDAAKLTSVGVVNPHIKIECMYATYRNFTGQTIYPVKYYAECYLLHHVAEQLDNVQKELETQGLGLLIWDAFRPMEAQKKLWDVVPDERYVAPPTKGGRHTRGTTVDLTIIDLKTGEPLDMGSGFDVFIDCSHSDCESITVQAKKNRQLLKEIMAKYGFNQLPTEWWHFDYQNMESYPPLDVSFNELN